MPKTISRTQVLAQEISQLEEAIASTEREFLAQQEENSEFAEALRLLSVGIAPYVPSGRVPLMDAVLIHLNEASDAVDRQYRWDAANKALASGQEAASSLQANLIKLRQQLAIANDELDWQKNYAPYLEKYRSGYLVPSPEVIKEQKIAALRKEIGDRKAQLTRAQAWLNQPEGNRPYFAGDALREADYLSRVIPVQTKQLQELIAAPVEVDSRYEAGLRKYVIGRVRIEPMLGDLLKAQTEYLKALGVFKLAIATYPEAAEFPASVLATPRIVSVETSSIKLVDEEQPHPKRLR